MGQHASDERSTSAGDHAPRHLADTDSPTSVIRPDFDPSGRLIGYGVGNEPARPDTYQRQPG